jgi:alkylation response protein AidB-like acyl-CoA dehydrogenase
MSRQIFTPSSEHEEFRTSVRRFAEANATSEKVRDLMERDEGYDPAVWSQMSQQLGLQGLHVPEEHGGSGFGFAELAIVFEELGRTLLPSPYLATAALGVNAILNAATPQQQAELLPRIATGQEVATLAYAEALDGPDGLMVEAKATADGYALSGHARHVLDGATASLLVVPARVDGELGLFVVEGSATGLTRTPMAGVDLTRRQARLDLDGVGAQRLGDSDAAGALRTTLQQAAVCLSAEMVGGAQVCLDMAVQYSKDRYQFGRPIGSFQAVKHRCADMLVDVECARSAVMYAAWAVEERPEELATVAPLTKAFASDAYVDCANNNIYVHGGIGYTWEHDAHLYLRRAMATKVLLGTPGHHRAHLASQLVDA